ncbi:MAG: 30S ribosomal protein S4e [Candidatus Nanoarchaeia archaeon]|nr:30S ribosomal protein S4e [Candidatus Nanoarchaeia archaeon]
MTKQHLKRLASPKSWSIKKKNITFTTRPNPGPHKLSLQMPITLILRDLLNVAKTTKEVKFILKNKSCLIDGSVCHDYRRPAGLMDVISISSINAYYRMLINAKNKLYLVPISKEESSFKLVKVSSKTNLKGGKIQLNFSDGRNMLIENIKKYSIGDTLKINLPDQKILEHYPCTSGASVILTSGTHVGELGNIKESKDSIITIQTENGEFTTKKHFAFVVGKTKPVITL